MANQTFPFVVQEEADYQRKTDVLRQQRAIINESPLDVNKTWCNPTLYIEIVGVDFGGGKMHYHMLNAEKDGKVSFADVAKTLESFKPGTLVVVERAHFATPQTPKSLAQPFTADQLIDMYSRCKKAGVTIKLFSHFHTRKARDWAAVATDNALVQRGKSDDKNDARGLAYYVMHNNGIALSNPPMSFGTPRKRQYGNAVRKRSNIVLNAARSRGYYGEVFPLVAKLARQIAQRFATVDSFINHNIAFAIAASVVCEVKSEAFLFTYNAQIPGADFFIKTVLLMSSVHHRGGVARSNLCWHGFRPFLAKFAKSFCECTKDGMRYQKFADFTTSQDDIRRLAWRSVRHELKAAYRYALERSAGLPFFDVLALDGLDNTHGGDRWQANGFR